MVASYNTIITNTYWINVVHNQSRILASCMVVSGRVMSTRWTWSEFSCVDSISTMIWYEKLQIISEYHIWMLYFFLGTNVIIPEIVCWMNKWPFIHVHIDMSKYTGNDQPWSVMLTRFTRVTLRTYAYV